MTFQQLQHLLAVHRTGSFSLAAKEMFVSQSAVSNAISGLEQELGCRIFVRSAHGLSLTPEGTRIVDLANGICERQTLLAQTETPSKIRCVLRPWITDLHPRPLRV